MKRHYIVYGVAGCGKSTIGQGIAKKLNLQFFDADDFHPDSNIQKMKSGTPLTDEDRRPWLERLHELITSNLETGSVLACSALKQSYRDQLKGELEGTTFIHLKGTYDVILNRMQSRNHFMPPELLQSQFDSLEPDSNALEIGIDESRTIEETIEHIITQLTKDEA